MNDVSEAIAKPDFSSFIGPQLRVSRWVCWLVAGFVGSFLVLTIKPGQPWDGDGELFILNSLNILHGNSYASTNYLVNPEHAIHPAAYPPGLPLLLVPIISAFGIDYAAIKIALCLCYSMLIFLFIIISDLLNSRAFVFILVFALGLNPFIMNFKEFIFSEFPFMLFSYAGIFFFEKLYISIINRTSAWSQFFWVLASAGAVAIAFEIRAIGIVLFATLAAVSAGRFAQLRYFGIAVMLLAIAGAATVGRSFPGDLGTYASYFNSGSADAIWALIGGIPHSGMVYVRAIAELFAGGGELSIVSLIIVSFILLSIVNGLCLSLINKPNGFDIFFILYFIAIIVYPVSEEPVRYALPLFPMGIFYFLHAAQSWTCLPDRAGLKACLVCASLIALYLPQYARLGADVAVSVDDLLAKELYREIQRQVPSDAVVVCSKPTIVALYGQRKTTNPPKKPTSEEFRRFVAQVKATWLVELRSPLYDEMSDVIPVVQEDLESVFGNKLFTLYKIRT